MPPPLLLQLLLLLCACASVPPLMNAYFLAVQCGAKAICAILRSKVWKVWAVQHGQPRLSNMYA